MKPRQGGPAAARRRVLLLALLALAVSLGACNDDDIQALVGKRYAIGNTAALGTAGWGPDSLRGFAITVPRKTTVYAFGTRGVSTAGNFQMALYTDSAGAPSALVAHSSGAPLLAGDQEVPATAPTQLVAGTYWVMFLVDSTINMSATASGTVNKAVAVTYGTPLPNPITGTTTPPSYDINLWIRVVD